jgi:nucleoside-diphosphate-sugar epimerase
VTLDLAYNLDWEIARRRVRLADCAERLLGANDRRVVVVGARGWIGRTAIGLLHQALGADAFANRVLCFGSADALVDLGNGYTVRQRALTRLVELERTPTILLHLAFLTKDKIGGMDAAAYEAANRGLSQSVHEALDVIGVDRLFVASSGAAALADDPSAPADLRLYGRLKREDEALFSSWAEAGPDDRRAAIGRIYNVSGPWINKHSTYALASFVLDALAGRPITVHAPRPVLRGYVAVRELVSLVLAALLARQGGAVLNFETGGEALELANVAELVARVVGGTVQRAPIELGDSNRYIGDDRQWRMLLDRFGIEHLPVIDQVVETAAWLAHETEISPPLQ